jgi:Fe-S cluster biogenesis protein NfuA
MKEKILAVLEAVRPLLAMHKGNVEFVDFDEPAGVVKVRFLGTCSGCALSDLTLKGGIEEIMKEQVPGVREVVAV